MRSFSYYSLLLLVLLLLGCEGTTPVQDRYQATKAFVLKDLKYGKDTLNYLDLYLPDNRTDQTPVVILLHGGGWVKGDKSQFYTKYAEELFANNWIIVNMNYSLASPTLNYKAILQDVKNAIGFLKQNSEKYSIPKTKYHLIGYSAGGHIALLYAYTADALNEIASVVSQAGPTNINDLKFKNFMDSAWQSPFIYPQLLGEEFVYDSKTAKACSPIHNIKPVPTFLIHGTRDDVVPFEQALRLKDSLKAKNIEHAFIAVRDARHNLTGFYEDSLRKTIRNWIEEKK